MLQMWRRNRDEISHFNSFCFAIDYNMKNIGVVVMGLVKYPVLGKVKVTS